MHVMRGAAMALFVPAGFGVAAAAVGSGAPRPAAPDSIAAAAPMPVRPVMRPRAARIAGGPPASALEVAGQKSGAAAFAPAFGACPNTGAVRLGRLG